MTIKEFFSNYDQTTALCLMKLKTPEIIRINGKTLNVCDSLDDMSYIRFIAGSELLERENTCFDLIRTIILLFHYKDITDKKFDLKRYDLMPLDELDVYFAYPVARHYRKLLIKQMNAHKVALKYIPKAEMMQAGLDRFDKYGFYNSCRAVAKSFGVRPEEVAHWDYWEVFVELCYQKDEGDFNEKYQNIIQSKYKTG